MRGCLRDLVSLALLVVSMPALAAEVLTAGKYQPHSKSVTPSGSLLHSVPIDAPAGIDGFVPQLSLVYQSGSGKGVSGIGWHIGGLSSIQRYPKTLAQDGVVGGIDYTSDDRLCLDGNRILVPVSGTSAATRNANYHVFTGTDPGLAGSDAHLELDGFVSSEW